MTSETIPVWLITGCSTGFGRELATLVLRRGWAAVITGRDRARLVDFEKDHGDRALVTELDIRDASQIKRVVKAAESRFGCIDVLVNNAGYGYQSSVEEGEDEEVRAQFEINVFGLFALTRAVLPGMRMRRSGHVINVTSTAGFVGLPSYGYYAASKHAVEGWAGALATEVEPLGIKVTCVQPGPFRTAWAKGSLRQTPNQIRDYADTAGARLTSTIATSDSRPGDPVKAAEAMIHITEVKCPPRRLVLGSLGAEHIAQHLKATSDDLSVWRERGIATDFF
jgi:NAD(P)-dependent dehydrogenase (short-subunit alcohol dehydrogenase family)